MSKQTGDGLNDRAFLRSMKSVSGDICANLWVWLMGLIEDVGPRYDLPLNSLPAPAEPAYPRVTLLAHLDKLRDAGAQGRLGGAGISQS